jgi:hypothetical protein
MIITKDEDKEPHGSNKRSNAPTNRATDSTDPRDLDSGGTAQAAQSRLATNVHSMRWRD